MASPSSVLSMGYGSWGSVNLLPTLGFGLTVVPNFRLCGTLTIQPMVSGVLSVSPKFVGTLDVTPLVTGELSVDCDCGEC